jgi:dihydrolipoamide dehydrogenase
MPDTRKHDAVVIGAGPAGYVCAIRLGQLGIDTLLIEKEYWGGVCLNVGCIPSKALIHAAKEAGISEEAATMGITLELKGVDMKKMQEWKGGIVKKLTGGVKQLVKGNGCDVLMGEAKLTSPTTIEVTNSDGTTKVEAKHVVLATGSRPIQIPGFEFDETFVLSSTGALDLDEIPEDLVVVGGGYIGLELGITYDKLGSKVTVVEMMDQILPGFSKDVVRTLGKTLRGLGVKVLTNAKAKGQSAPKGKGKKGEVVVETKDGEEKIAADKVVVSVGRRPNSEGLGLKQIGVNVDERGFVPTDGRQRTNVANVFSIGDLSGEPMLAHAGSYEGEVAAEVIAGKAAENDARCVPAVVFTEPEIATVGILEPEAEKKGLKVKVGKFPYAALGRALSTNATDGYFKLICDAETDAVLGAEIVGADASALIAECALAIEMGAVSQDLALTIHAHPTLPEGVMEAAKAIHGEAIHVINKKPR